MKISVKAAFLYAWIPVCMVILSSCKKSSNIVNKNILPEITVSLNNQFGIYGGPTVRTSLAEGGKIDIVFSLPENTGRTIKEITRVAAGTAYSSVQATTGLYNTAPVAGNGKTVTFSTTLTEYVNITKLAVPAPAVAGTTSAALLSRNFYFLITLDNGQTIIPTYVRVYVDK